MRPDATLDGPPPGTNANTSENHVRAQNGVSRVGIVISRSSKLQIPALRYLLLHLNCLQRHFEYEVLPNEMPNSPLGALDSDTERVNRKEIKEKRVPEFLVAYKTFLRNESAKYGLKQEPPDNFVFISLATFDDEYYSTRSSYKYTQPNRMSVLALGNWDREIAPPSILEFILTLVVRESIAFVCPSLEGSIHLGTKGCICDFTSSLEEAKFKALEGFICEYCRSAIENDGFPGLPEAVTRILRKRWLGKRSDPGSPAGILANLKYDLFVTKGLTPDPWERFVTTLQEEGTKQLLDILAKVVFGIIVLYLAVHGITIHN
jgi:hypothetical protein